MLDLSPKQWLATLPEDEQTAWLLAQDTATLVAIDQGEWWWEARPKQLPPDDPLWTVWLILAGRGWGKTRSGAEWVIDSAEACPADITGHPTTWLVIGETIADTRTFNINGPSGIRAVLHRRGYTESPKTGPGLYVYTKAPKPIITLPQGQLIYFEGADDEDTGRGYNLAGVWWDEPAKCRYAHPIWKEGLLPGLRSPLPAGHKPRAVLTGTPKPIALLRDLVKRGRDPEDPYVHLTTGPMLENADNLSPDAVRELLHEYRGTSLGRQELGGELLEEAEGALWTLDSIETGRVKVAPELVSVTVGMDPAGTGQGDECGLVAVGRGKDNHDYVLADWSKRVSGRAAALRAWRLMAHVNGDWLVYEDNLGKAWLTQVLADAYKELQTEGVFPDYGVAPMRAVTAVQGKKLRAQPIAMRYEQTRYHHVGDFPVLEQQMVTWVPEDDPDSPDRVDALVHAGAYNRKRERGRAVVAIPGGAMTGTANAVADRMSSAGLSPLA
jgi:phage terminase large subunit-like protein